MRFRGNHRRHLAAAVLTAVLLLFCLSGGVMASSGGGHEEGDGEHAAKGWQATDTYRVMNFAVLAVGLFFILRKPASQWLNARIQGIKSELETLESKKREAEKALAEYNEKLSLLDREAQSIIADYVKQGEAARERILKAAEASAEKLELQARRNIENEFQKAKSNLRQEVLDKALIKAKAMIKESITQDDQETLVDDYLQKVVT